MTGRVQTAFKVLSAAALTLAAAGLAAAYKAGILTDQAAMTDFVSKAGFWAPVVFILIQIIQVIIPILPGGISCLGGVLLFGAVRGFILNYAGICIGSVLIFLLARRFGRPLVEKLFSLKLLDRYDRWTGEKKIFTRLFALAIFFPFSPDDFLCALAGTTKMSFRTFVLIIIFGKPVSIMLYSIFLQTGWNLLLPGV